MIHRKLLPLGLIVLLSACSTSKPSKPSRYSIEQDLGPSVAIDLSHVADAIPIAEAKSRGGNRSPYTVLGKQYAVLDSDVGYRQRGIASWYGQKFHGHLTSNGETYDMYAMTAAHKSLPLPSFVRVTNLDNGKQVVVRVNDRGPFHGARLIDLSYAAAFKLDMLKQGTARVEIEALTAAVQRPASSALIKPDVIEPSISQHRLIQVGAFSSLSSAQSVKTRVELLLGEQLVSVTKTAANPPLYRVRIGPVSNSPAGLEGLLAQLSAEGFVNVQLLDLP